jgi:hypothetical protein
VPRHLTAFLSYGAADDLPSYPVVVMAGAAPGDVRAAMERGLSVQVATREEAVAVLEHQGLPPEHIAFQLFVAEGR